MNDLLQNVSLTQVRLGHAVIEHLSKAIFEGRLKPGDNLPSEKEIATAFGVSKQVAREAVRELAAIGVVEIYQGRPSRICETRPENLSRFFRFAISSEPEGFEQVIEFRRIIEVPIARLAAARREQRHLDEIARHMERMATHRKHPKQWAICHMEFHSALAEASRNRLLVYQFEALKPLVLEVDKTLRETSKIDSGTLDRHAAIVDAVRAADPDAAADAMIAHFGAIENMSAVGLRAPRS